MKDIDGGTYDSLKEMAKHEKVVAYGEIGLDFFRNLSPRGIQIHRFVNSWSWHRSWVFRS